MDKENDKDRYRKKPQTPQKKTPATVKIIKRITEELKILEYIVKLEKDDNSKLQQERLIAINKILLKIGMLGVRLELIESIFPIPKKIYGDMDRQNPHVLKHINPDVVYSPQWEKILSEYEKRSKEFIKKKKVITSCRDSLLRLPEVSGELHNHHQITAPIRAADFNHELRMCKDQMKRMTDTYIDFLALSYSAEDLHGHGTKADLKTIPKLINQKSAIWGQKIVALIDELRRVMSPNPAYKTAATFLHLSYPHIFKADDSDTIKARYNYNKKQGNSAKG